jgi:CBS domain-containing protein
VDEMTDLLGGLALFAALDAEDLARLVAHAQVESFAAGATVVATGAQLHHLWVVRTGVLEVVDGARIVDLLGPGDTFGPATDLPAPSGMRAHEASQCLRIPDPRTILAHPERLSSAPMRLLGAPTLGRGDQPVARLMRPIVWCTNTDRIRDVAERITTAGQSCALLRIGGDLGIATDVDFRRNVATGQVSVDAPITALATVPALTLDEDATEATGLLRMIERGVHHLVIVDRLGQPAGVLRAVDLAGAQVRDPLLIRSAIDAAQDIEELAVACRRLPMMLVELCGDDVPATHIGAIHAAVVDAAVKRILHLQHHLALDGVRHSWVLLGSLARREPLPLSDVDTALIWADGSDPADVLRADAREVLRGVQRCGFTLCANGANAHNPVFSRSRSDWITAARSWQHDPTQENALLLSAMVADSRPLTEPELGNSLTATIRSHTRTSQFLRALLDEALSWRPPIGFIRDFVVHHSGEHRGQLDLKPGGLTPVIALARWIAIAAGDASGTTVERLRRGTTLGLLTTDEADTLSGGFESVYGLLLRHEVQDLRASESPTSTFISPKELDSLTRRHLRETFRAIAAVQARVDREWLTRLPE